MGNELIKIVKSHKGYGTLSLTKEFVGKPIKISLLSEEEEKEFLLKQIANEEFKKEVDERNTKLKKHLSKLREMRDKRRTSLIK